MEVERHTRLRTARAPVAGVRVGRLQSAEPGQAPRVTFAPAGGAAVEARTTVPLSPADIGREVLLVFESGNPLRPIVTGVLLAPEMGGAIATSGPLPAKEAVADGQYVEIEAGKELVLRCGKSSISLRADGTVHVRGMRIISRARGTNKVKGANVEIN